MALEKVRPGFTTSLSASTWNALVDHVESDSFQKPPVPTQRPVLPLVVIPAIDVKSLCVVGLDRPVPNPLGGEITATAKATNAVATSGATVVLSDVVITNRGEGDSPSAPSSVTRPTPGPALAAGESLSLVYNGTAWSILKPGERGFQLQTQVIFRGVAPEARHANGFAIVQRGVAANQKTTAIASGVTWARLDVAAESDEFAAPVANASDADPPVLTLRTGSSGAKILWKEPGLGERYGLVLLGGGGGGGSSLTPVVVYDSLTGGTVNTDGDVTLGEAARCLPVAADGGVVSPNLGAEFINAKVWSLASLDLGESGCCSDEVAAVPTGIRISSGLGADGNDRVYDADSLSGAVVVRGTGVAPDASITVTISQGATTLTPGPVVNNGDGTWEAPSQTLASLAKGVVKVTATDGATTDVVVITYADDDNTTELGHFTGRPPAPNMTDATDLGASNTDNKTSDRTPTFACAHGGVSPIDAGGPIPRLYVRGVLVASGTLSSYTTTPPVVSSVDLTPGADLDLGRQTAQLVLEWTDTAETYWSPPSLPLRINIDTTATEEAEPAKRYARLGVVATMLNESYLVSIDKCRRELSAAEITKLDA